MVRHRRGAARLLPYLLRRRIRLCTAAGGSSTGFSTGCEHTPTHWKQTALYLAAPVQLAAGDTVSGTVSFARDAAYKRSYNISVIYAHNGKHVATQMWGMQ